MVVVGGVLGGGDTGTTVVAMRPDAPAGELLRALDGTDARIIWTDRAGGVWVVQNLSWQDGLALYGSGALYVSGTTSPAGCATGRRRVRMRATSSFGLKGLTM